MVSFFRMAKVSVLLLFWCVLVLHWKLKQKQQAGVDVNIMSAVAPLSQVKSSALSFPLP